MTIDEAIRHAEEVAKKNYGKATEYQYQCSELSKCLKCGDEHMQLSEWLKDYKRLKEQESKTGHWEEVGEEYIQVYDLNGIPSCGDERICSECGFETVFIGEHCSQYKFCPNCGADMRGEEA